MEKIFFFMLERLHYINTSCFSFSFGQNVWLKWFQVSQTLISVSQYLMTDELKKLLFYIYKLSFFGVNKPQLLLK